jgi:hypothetical protein
LVSVWGALCYQLLVIFPPFAPYDIGRQAARNVLGFGQLSLQNVVKDTVRLVLCHSSQRGAESQVLGNGVIVNWLPQDDKTTCQDVGDLH